MDRCALFVDAGYLLADGAMAAVGTRRRDSVSWDYPGLLKLLKNLAEEHTSLPLLRCYWYEATVEGRRTPEHDSLADLPNLKMRLSRMRPGRREGVDTEIHRDLATLARNAAISEAVVVSAEEDLGRVIADIQDLGLRVALLHVTVDGNWTISRSLRQECDGIIEIGGLHLQPYVELIAGAEPVPYPGADAGALSNGHLPAIGHAPHPALASGQHPGPPAIYTSPALAAYHPADQQAPQRQRAAVPAAPAAGQARRELPQRQAAPAPDPGPEQPAAAGGEQPGDASGQQPPQSPAVPRGRHSQPREGPPPPSVPGPSQQAQPAPGPNHPAQPAPGPSHQAQPAPGPSQQAQPAPGPNHPAQPAPGPNHAGHPGQPGQQMPPDQAAGPGPDPHAYPAAAAPPLQAPTAGAASPAGPGQQRPGWGPGYPGSPAPGGAYVPAQHGHYGGPQHEPPPAAPSGGSALADAVQAAHAEGHDFGESVARDAPALWLEAVLARKPRMPSDLEARLLQGSSLPIDYLLHDEVRHALRRGFWDALEGARR